MSDASPAPALSHIECPDCGEVIPITANPATIEDGNLVVNLNYDDFWAHYFTHDAR